ncbi:MAG: SGNH/GDSL hydrolase family protein [Opitutaceae bacterium]
MSTATSTRPARALILGDSLGAPRPHRGQKLDVTWPVLLKKTFPSLDIWQRCRPASMSDSVRKEFNLFSDSIDAFGLVVIQVGIGDCCPRPYPLFLEQFILTYGFRGLQKRLNSLYPPLLKLRSKPWIGRAAFVENIRFMIDTTRERNPAAAISVVKIGTPCAEFVRKVCNAAACAADYNRALESLCRSYGASSRVTFVDPYADFAPEELFIADGHHLTQLGHRSVADSLEPSFRQLAAETAREPASVHLFDSYAPL